MFAPCSVNSVSGMGPGGPLASGGLGLSPLASGQALQRVDPYSSLQSLAAPSALTEQFQLMAQTQQLTQLMGLLLSLMQSRGSAQQGGSSEAIQPVGGSDAASGGGADKSSDSQAMKSDSNTPKGATVTRQGKPIGAQIAKQFDAMVAAAKQDGVNITITSGFRSRAEQERLYAAYKNGTGNLAAKPGTSNHESGDALDLGPPSAYGWLKQNAGRFGFKNTVAGEPWHYSLTGN